MPPGSLLGGELALCERNMKTCDCCGKNAAHPLCGGCCEQCAKPAVCDCGCELSEDDACDWTPENQVVAQCEKCRREDSTNEAMTALRDEAIRVAIAAGWSIASADTRRSGSWYYTLTRGDETLNLRIADHGTAYCSEDVSLVIDGHGNPDDHSLADWQKVVA